MVIANFELKCETEALFSVAYLILDPGFERRRGRGL